MIFRTSQRLAKKLKILSLQSALPDPNPFADWSAHLFTANRLQYVILTNTRSLYSIVLHGRGIASDSQFLDRALSSIHGFMVADELEFIFRRFIAPAPETVQFASAINRSVTSSMNDLVFHARMWLTESDLAPFEASCKLNEMPMSHLSCRNPRDAFKSLRFEQRALEDGNG